ncbi:putative membrane protein [Phenylobacterium haematophilum]|uniref:Putative membrane protein n=1 Tax=Phenylobacterium haematophilum TaxID=98513 RepID=A0A840A4U1_9CAUL|nr:TPM domain-containing protein [Phenylobacterium haematophilum]MBB3893009.1 putative membrane protein [Phenylobacterium haematophilum]
MLLEAQDHARIAQAVAAAGATTSGEIVCVVTNEAAPYAEVPLAWAALGALVLPVALLAAASATRHFDYTFGGWTAGHIGAVHAAVLTTLSGYVLLQCLLFAGLFALVSVPAIRRRLTPLSLRRMRVRERALEQFFVRGLDSTRERTGVLIFVSLKDRRAEVLADSGISGRVDPSVWDGVVAELVDGVRGGRPGDGLVAAVERCGRILTKSFPAQPGNPNELPDTLAETDLT